MTDAAAMYGHSDILTSFIQISGATQLNSWNDRNVNLSPVCSSFDARPAMRRPKAERSRASVMKLTIVQKFCHISLTLFDRRLCAPSQIMTAHNGRQWAVG